MIGNRTVRTGFAALAIAAGLVTLAGPAAADLGNGTGAPNPSLASLTGSSSFSGSATASSNASAALLGPLAAVLRGVFGTTGSDGGCQSGIGANIMCPGGTGGAH
ncbi:hypothetical protein [Nocardia heshunensis]